MEPCASIRHKHLSLYSFAIFVSTTPRPIATQQAASRTSVHRPTIHGIRGCAATPAADPTGGQFGRQLKATWISLSADQPLPNEAMHPSSPGTEEILTFPVPTSPHYAWKARRSPKKQPPPWNNPADPDIETTSQNASVLQHEQ